MDGKDIIKGAASIGVGYVAGDAIGEALGGGVTGLVGGFVGGGIVSGITSKTIDVIDDETGIVSDLGSVVDDIFDLF